MVKATKMHKTPVGSRFITASNWCAIKPVSQVLTQCSRWVFNILRKMHDDNKTKDYIWITIIKTKKWPQNLKIKLDDLNSKIRLDKLNVISRWERRRKITISHLVATMS